MARTAVVAGTATAVSNRVSRRQAGRWAQQDTQQMAPEPAYAPPPTYAPPPQPEASTEDKFEQLEKLGQLKAAGILTEGEFQAEKARLLR